DTITEHFSVKVHDSETGMTHDTQDVVITIHGVNDAPTFTSVDASGAVFEDSSTPTLSTSGFLYFRDTDAGDLHSATVAPSVSAIGTLKLDTSDFNAHLGTVDWTFTVENS